MNFIINVDPEAEPVGSARVALALTSGGTGSVDEAELRYAEFRHDTLTGKNFVCIVYSLPEWTP